MTNYMNITEYIFLVHILAIVFVFDIYHSIINFITIFLIFLLAIILYFYSTL